ncbi:MAG: hypothetical protein EBR82_27790 [Caulobacteraceae bacterium]|nr:hypothetical protein [Caulobacteraceae bacterium]
MANNVDTKLQANFKMANGDLINVYAVDQADFEAQLTAIQDTVELIKSVSNSLMGRVVTTQVDAWTIKEAIGVVADTLGGQEQPTCKHGYMEFKTGISKAGKPYKCWSCPSKDRKDQCPPNWVN